MAKYTVEQMRREHAQYERELREKETRYWRAYRDGLVRYAAARNAEPKPITKGVTTWR